MKKFVLAAVAATTLALTGCQSVDRDVATPAVIGGLGGAAIGGAVGGDIEGALIGGAVGAAAGALVGVAANRPGECVYRDGRGNRYISDCPDGY